MNAENNGQNFNGELDEIVPIVSATNDVFSPGFCSLMDSAFRPKSTSGINEDDIPKHEQPTAKN
jgi:hypothetical protein